MSYMCHWSTYFGSNQSLTNILRNLSPLSIFLLVSNYTLQFTFKIQEMLVAMRKACNLAVNSMHGEQQWVWAWSTSSK